MLRVSLMPSLGVARDKGIKEISNLHYSKWNIPSKLLSGVVCSDSALRDVSTLWRKRTTAEDEAASRWQDRQKVQDWGSVM